MIYKFRAGTRVSTVKAQAVGEVLEKIRERDGRVDTEVFLAEAAKKRSPVHAGFEWDDGKAGHQFRLIQARQMIRAVTVVLEEGDEPAYVHIKVDKDNYYQSAQVAARNVEEWDLVRNTALRRIQSACDVLDDLDKVAIRHKPAKTKRVRSVKNAVNRAHEQLSAT